MAQHMFTGWRHGSPDPDSQRQALTGASGGPRTPQFTMSMDGGAARRPPGLGLFSKRSSYWGIQRSGVQGSHKLYWNDLFHTLLNMPRYRFVAVFFTVYILQYMAFAILYLAQSDRCIPGIHHFSHAMWFSVQTAATIGYGNIAPDPACAAPNLLVMIQVICAALIDYSMLGVVFARFAAPHKRSQTIRFSQAAVVNASSEDGAWRLVFRVANIRKHPILKPKLQLLLATPDDTHGSSFTFEELEIQNVKEQQASLKLGLPVTLAHVITPTSPLWGASIEALAARDAELLVFLDGTDAMTSNSLQARHAYNMADVRLSEQFAPLHLTSARGRVALDFSGFDVTLPTEAPRLTEDYHTMGGSPSQLGQPSPRTPGSHGTPGRAPSSHVLRCTAFEDLTRRSKHGRGLALAATAGAAAAAATANSPGPQDHRSSQVQALVAAVLADPVCSDSLKRLATVVQTARSE